MKHFLISAAAAIVASTPVWAQAPYPTYPQPQPGYPASVQPQPVYPAYAQPQPGYPVQQAYAPPQQPAAVNPNLNAINNRWRSVAATPQDAYRQGLINRWELEQLEGPMPQSMQGPSPDGSKGGGGDGSFQ